MAINTASIGRALMPLVNKWYGIDRMDKKEEIWKKFYTIEKTKLLYETLVSVGGFGVGMKKTEGGDIAKDEMSQGFEQLIKQASYGLSFDVTEEHVMFNQYMKLAKSYTKKLAHSMKVMREILHHAPLNNGFDSNYPGADGVELFSTANLLERGGTFKNEPETSLPLSQAAFEQARTDIKTQVDGTGKYMDLNMRILILHPNLYSKARRIIESKLQSNTAENAVNVVSDYFPEGICETPYLTSQTQWIIKTDVEGTLQHLRSMNERLESDYNKSNKNTSFLIDEKFGFGIGPDKRGFYSSPGT